MIQTLVGILLFLIGLKLLIFLFKAGKFLLGVIITLLMLAVVGMLFMAIPGILAVL